MVESTITVTAPSRLHFGLLSFGWPGRRQYGGVGVMLNKPMCVTLKTAPTLATTGPHADRAATFAQHWAEQVLAEPAPQAEIQIETAPAGHVGLGSGTQLALAVAAGLYSLYERPLPAAAQLATSVGRGGRSAVGTYGFLHGGLITEKGRLNDEPLADLHQRVEVPAAWRFVLIRPTDRRGVHGEDERRAFLKLPPVPTATTEALWAELSQQMLPALAAADEVGFGESVYRYGVLAGQCFARVQGGPFASPAAKNLVAHIRGLDVRGVGQSSWGPTLFAITRDEDQAEWLVDQLTRGSVAPPECEICRPNNQGWQCRVAAC